jgi:hypothetical protein
MRILGVCLLVLALLGLSGLLVVQLIPLGVFLALGTLWLLASLILLLGPETISEITIWKASIKRDVQAAKQFRDEAQQIREDLRRLTKTIVEDAFILGSNSFLTLGVQSEAKARLEKNLGELSKFAEPIKEREDAWWVELQALVSEHEE